jgi:hypothetical protein
MQRLIVVLLLAAIGCRPAAVPSPVPDGLSVQEGVRIMRWVATLEVELAASSGGYGNLTELLRRQALADHASDRTVADFPVTLVDPTTATVLAYTLSVTPTSDRTHFQAALTPQQSRGCTTRAWYVDDRDVIYQGHSIC